MQTDLQGDNWEKVGGEGLWEEWKNKKTGESTLKTHELKKVWSAEGCDHYFEHETPSSRIIICNKCGLGKKYNLGIDELKKGKLIKRKIVKDN